MNVISLYRPSVWPRVAVLGAVVGALCLAATGALAGECPNDKRVADGMGQKQGPSMPKDVTDVVRYSTDLSKEPLALQGRQFRLRQLEMKPGGIVPWHSHNDRPAMIYIVSGEVVEYASNCAVPITHRSGDVAAERNGTSHWWQNTGTKPAVLISVDLFPGGSKMDEHMM
jgi:quercetin dioxygenase-like cupin family protein